MKDLDRIIIRGETEYSKDGLNYLLFLLISFSILLHAILYPTLHFTISYSTLYHILLYTLPYPTLHYTYLSYSTLNSILLHTKLYPTLRYTLSYSMCLSYSTLYSILLYTKLYPTLHFTISYSTVKFPSSSISVIYRNLSTANCSLHSPVSLIFQHGLVQMQLSFQLIKENLK